METFKKSFTQQEPIPEETIADAIEVMRSGRLHRYNHDPNEISKVSELERAFAQYQGTNFALACASGGYALHVALRAAGLKNGDQVLMNAWTLAPVPGAIHNAGGVPVMVEIGADLCIDIDDLEKKARSSNARFLMLSHMRGHIGDMAAIVDICQRYSLTLIEDCAHTMGARWNGRRSGSFGKIACFSTQTYKHLNSGEGGLLTTDDPSIAANAIMRSGSYMLYERHGARPELEVFDEVRLTSPNYSGRMDNLRAALLLGQLKRLDQNIQRWNERYWIIEEGLRKAPHLTLIERPHQEAFVGSSIQFRFEGQGEERTLRLLAQCQARGVELKWFGAAKPEGFTSRHDSWLYLGEPVELPATTEILESTLDMRIPLTFDHEDCALIGAIIAEESSKVALSND